jgi:hypothetical protein
MKIAYFSNVLGLRDMPEPSTCTDEFNQSMIEFLDGLRRDGASMTICQTDGDTVQWLDVENGVTVNVETAVCFCYDTLPHFATISA